MPYTVFLARSAERTLQTLPWDVRERLLRAIDSLASTPRPATAVAMQGAERGRLRVRVGDWRIVYEVNDGALTVLVVRVGNRREVYR